MLSWLKPKIKTDIALPLEEAVSVDLSGYERLSDSLFFDALSAFPVNDMQRDVSAEITVFSASIFSSVFTYCAWGERTKGISSQIADRVINHHLQNYYLYSLPSDYVELFWERHRTYVRIIVRLYVGQRSERRVVSRELCRILYENTVGRPCDADLDRFIVTIDGCIDDAEQLAKKILSSLKST